MFAKKFICFDIGKTKILASVLKIGRHGYKFLDLVESKNPRNPQKIEKILLDYCLAARKKYWAKKTAVSAAHIVDPEKKIVTQGKVCYGTEVFSFAFLEKNGFPVRIENDGRCFASGEYYFGKGKGKKSILALTIGTEIGGGLMSNGINYQGAHNSALEVSHISANYNGQWIDWAGLCAGTGIENSYRRKTKKKITAEKIFQLAKENDPVAKNVIQTAANILGNGTASAINILDPEVVVFGGSISKQKKCINQAIKIARKNVFNKKANYKFAVSSLGNKANLLGAALLYKK